MKIGNVNINVDQLLIYGSVVGLYYLLGQDRTNAIAQKIASPIGQRIADKVAPTVTEVDYEER